LRSTFEAEITRTSIGKLAVPPTLITWRDSSTRSSFACTVGGTSSMSSRNSVPVCASSKRPRFSAWALVNAPRSCPNSSDSSSSCGIADNAIFTSGRSARGLMR
jgi:hypothetical protein